MHTARPYVGSLLLLFTVFVAGRAAAAQVGVVRVEVQHDGAPVVGAIVVAGVTSTTTNQDGVATLTLPEGRVDVRVSQGDLLPVSVAVTVAAGSSHTVRVELEEAPDVDEEVIVVASTRTGKRLEDQPLRVEVVPGEEVQEKIMMTPGDISMLLTETNGLRVQTASPSLGGANVRIQGLRGRYSQILSDGLPLFGAQTGSIGILQIPPMDLGQVEVIKGVASALYGMSAVGGVINLVSRRPPAEGRENEILVNTTSHAGADVVNWQAGQLSDTWRWSFLGGAHVQNRTDLDDDGWTDLPRYRRVVARPRLYWDDGAGRSMLLTVGGTAESRTGGTMPNALAPNARPFREGVTSRRFDGGLVARIVTGAGRVVAVRASATGQFQDRTLGDERERDRHTVSFGEVTLMGATGAHTWVVGGSTTVDGFRATDVSRFNYTHVVPAVFVQDDFAPNEHVTVSASARLDAHSEFGTFASPRVSMLVRPRDEWSVRLSGGRGYFAPTPFTEESETVGLTSLAPLGSFEAERATSGSADVTWTPGPYEVTLTAFRSRISGALALRAAGGGSPYRVELTPVDGPVSTRGTEFILRYHREGFDIVATHMWLASTEPDLDGGRRTVPLNPRHSASFDMLRQIGPARIGFEVFFTGRQALEGNPYRDRGKPHTLFGGLVDWAIGPGRIFVNVENVGNVRQTRFDPLVRPVRADDGRWTVDGWAPLEGRTLNAGFRYRF